MNKLKLPVLIIFLCLSGWLGGLSPALAASPNLQGTWRGTLSAARYDPIELVFHIHAESEGSATYSATLDIPTQSLSGLPVDSISVGRGVTLRLPGIQAEFYGMPITDDEGHLIALDGDWNQSGEHVPLRLERDAN